jgi:hypothetical protein
MTRTRLATAVEEPERSNIPDGVSCSAPRGERDYSFPVSQSLLTISSKRS